MKIAGYARMSTDDQQLSPEVQEQMIRDWYAREKSLGKLPDDADFIGMFIDPGVTSKINMLHRKAGQQLLVALGKGDMIVCAKFNRAFRSAGDAEATLNTCEEAGIKMVFLDMAIDTSNANGKMIAGIMAVVSKHERDLRSETTKDALNAKRRKGEAVTVAPPGWRNVRVRGAGKLKPDPGKRMIALAAKRLLRSGLSRSEVYKAIRPHRKKYGFKGPLSEQTLVAYAASACLDFPRYTNTFIEKLLGFKISTLQFIRHGDHAMAKSLLKQRLIEQGLYVDEQQGTGRQVSGSSCQ